MKTPSNPPSQLYRQLTEAISAIIRLNDGEEQVIRSLFQEKTAAKGAHFLAGGEVCREVIFIGSGLVRYYINNDGEELNYSFGKEGEFVCNYESFLDRSPSNKNIQFIENTHYLAISHEGLQRLYKGLKEGERLGRLVCEQLFISAIRQLTSMYADAPEQRYLQFVSQYPDLLQRLPQYHISSFVRVKPQSLSRIRRRIAKG